MCESHFSVILTLSKSLMGLSRLRFNKLPSIGNGVGPGGKFLALWHLRQRIKKKTQIHRRMKETNIVEWIRLIWSGWLYGWVLKCCSTLSPASSGCLNVNERAACYDTWKNTTEQVLTGFGLPWLCNYHTRALWQPLCFTFPPCCCSVSVLQHNQ